MADRPLPNLEDLLETNPRSIAAKAQYSAVIRMLLLANRERILRLSKAVTVAMHPDDDDINTFSQLATLMLELEYIRIVLSEQLTLKYKRPFDVEGSMTSLQGVIREVINEADFTSLLEEIRKEADKEKGTT